jgi:hypothetical protein
VRSARSLSELSNCDQTARCLLGIVSQATQRGSPRHHKQQTITRQPPNIMSMPSVITKKRPSRVKWALTRKRRPRPISRMGSGGTENRARMTTKTKGGTYNGIIRQT